MTMHMQIKVFAICTLYYKIVGFSNLVIIKLKKLLSKLKNDTKIKTLENLRLVFFWPTILQQLPNYNNYFMVPPIAIYRLEKRIKMHVNIL